MVLRVGPIRAQALSLCPSQLGLACRAPGYACIPHRGRRVHSISNFLSLLAVRVARDERQEIVQRHGEITPGAALCIAVSVPP